ncbi:MAG: flagellar basal body-associated FliL family protein [Gammaproteobacteria bacterium]|nr:flagellar basal body-associated FliL family protein [Gammaproteobacteria bacterium]
MQKILLSLLVLAFGIAAVQAADEEQPATGKSAYISLGDPMVLNLSGKRKLTFLQISADVLVRDSDTEEAVKIHVPAIRHSLIMLLSEQKAADIKSPAKREEIRQVATANVKRLVTDLSGNGEVAEVLFSNILVQ